MDFTAIILAGGKGRRLGRDKIWLELKGENLLQRVVGSLAPLGGEIMVVLDREKPLPPLSPPVRTVVDLVPGRGSLGGLYTGLRASPLPYVLALACDMPFLSLPLLRHLLGLAHGYDVVVPRLGGLLEPLHTVYARTCLGPMEELLKKKGKRIVDFYNEVRVRYVEETEVIPLDPQRLSFSNINTPADLDMAERWLEGKS